MAFKRGWFRSALRAPSEIASLSSVPALSLSHTHTYKYTYKHTCITTCSSPAHMKKHHTQRLGSSLAMAFDAWSCWTSPMRTTHSSSSSDILESSSWNASSSAARFGAGASCACADGALKELIPRKGRTHTCMHACMLARARTHTHTHEYLMCVRMCATYVAARGGNCQQQTEFDGRGHCKPLARLDTNNVIGTDNQSNTTKYVHTRRTENQIGTSVNEISF